MEKLRPAENCLLFAKYITLCRRRGVNFINLFTHSFYAPRSRKRKKPLDLTDFFALLGSESVKAACKMLVKLNLVFVLLFVIFV